jgi:hypothetical protein
MMMTMTMTINSDGLLLMRVVGDAGYFCTDSSDSRGEHHCFPPGTQCTPSPVRTADKRVLCRNTILHTHIFD